MKLYLDFDGTLFNTDKFYQDYLTICLKNNIMKEEVENAKNKLFQSHLFNLDTLTNYLYKTYKLTNNFLLEINKLYQNNYLFPDVLNNLKILVQKYDLCLFTYGDTSFQKKKIESTKIENYFKKIIISEIDKSKLNIDYEHSLFIDNNPKEIEKFFKKKAQVIRLRRKEDKYFKDDLSVDCLEYENLEEFVKNNFKIN